MGSNNRKKSLILKLLRSCRGCETKYLVRTLVQNLRVGASLLSILTALGRAAAFHFHTSPSKEQEQHCSESVRKTYAVCPNLEKIASALLKEEEKGGGGGGGGLDDMIRTCCLSPGVPVKPMLAKTANGVEDAAKLLQKAEEKKMSSDINASTSVRVLDLRSRWMALICHLLPCFDRIPEFQEFFYT